MADKTIKTGDTDITEAVQVLYDLAHNSMDWGSGMLDHDEMKAVVDFALLMGWDAPPLPSSTAVWQRFAEQYPTLYETVVHPAREAVRYTGDKMHLPERTEIVVIKR